VGKRRRGRGAIVCVSGVLCSSCAALFGLDEKDYALEKTEPDAVISAAPTALQPDTGSGEPDADPPSSACLGEPKGARVLFRFDAASEAPTPGSPGAPTWRDGFSRPNDDVHSAVTWVESGGCGGSGALEVLATFTPSPAVRAASAVFEWPGLGDNWGRWSKLHAWLRVEPRSGSTQADLNSFQIGVSSNDYSAYSEWTTSPREYATAGVTWSELAAGVDVSPEFGEFGAAIELSGVNGLWVKLFSNPIPDGGLVTLALYIDDIWLE
jgi:hypothetical protein